jgi:tetratricopeptide (TPR) repeat protein
MHIVKNSCKAYIPFLFYCFAVFSKPMAITLPIVLLLLDVYPLQRITNTSCGQRIHVIFIEKIHYYITVLAISVITILSQDVIYIEQPSIIEKLNIFIASLQHYLISFFYPFELSPLYPMELMNPVSLISLYLFGIAAILFVVYLSVKKQSTVLLAISYFLITLLPVTGIVKFAAEHPYADRYTYLPMAGFYMLTGYLAAETIIKSGKYRFISITVILIVLLVFAQNTHQYKNVWRSDLSLWGYVVRQYPHVSSTVHQNLGNSYYEHGMYRDATVQYIYAIVLNKHNLSACSNLALAYNKLDDIEKSLSTHELCVNNNPENPQAYIQAGDAFYTNKQYKRAFDYYKHSIEIEPNYPYGLLRLGKLFIHLGDIEQSIRVLDLISSDSHAAFEAKLLLAQAYANKDKDIALDILTTMKQVYGDDERIKKLIERLK